MTVVLERGSVSGGGAGAGLFPLNQRCSTFMISCSSAGTWADRYCRYLDSVDIYRVAGLS